MLPDMDQTRQLHDCCTLPLRRTTQALPHALLVSRNSPQAAQHGNSPLRFLARPQRVLQFGRTQPRKMIDRCLGLEVLDLCLKSLGQPLVTPRPTQLVASSTERMYQKQVSDSLRTTTSNICFNSVRGTDGRELPRARPSQATS